MLLIVLLFATVLQSQAPSPLGRLVTQTGWVFAGDISADRTVWVSQVSYRPAEPRRDARLPRPGDVIEMISEEEVIVVGFGETGEEKILEPPASMLRPVDKTGLKIKPGSFLNVQDVYLQQTISGFSGVWLRVSPAQRP